MNLKRSIIVFFLLIGLSSCWFPCAPGISGTIIDDTNGHPLDSTLVEFYEEGNFVNSLLTDSTGWFGFNTENEPVFMTRDCERSFSLTITKNGYDSLEYIGTAPAVQVQIRLK